MSWRDDPAFGAEAVPKVESDMAATVPAEEQREEFLYRFIGEHIKKNRQTLSANDVAEVTKLTANWWGEHKAGRGKEWAKAHGARMLVALRRIGISHSSDRCLSGDEAKAAVEGMLEVERNGQ